MFFEDPWDGRKKMDPINALVGALILAFIVGAAVAASVCLWLF